MPFSQHCDSFSFFVNFVDSDTLWCLVLKTSKSIVYKQESVQEDSEIKLTMSVDASNFCFSGKIVRIAPLEWNSMYHQLADGKTLGLKWKCIERRSPTPTPSENNTVTDTTVDQ